MIAKAKPQLAVKPHAKFHSIDQKKEEGKATILVRQPTNLAHNPRPACTPEATTKNTKLRPPNNQPIERQQKTKHERTDRTHLQVAAPTSTKTYIYLHGNGNPKNRLPTNNTAVHTLATIFAEISAAAGDSSFAATPPPDGAGASFSFAGCAAVGPGA